MTQQLRSLLSFLPLLATVALACSVPAIGGKARSDQTQAAAAPVIHADPALWELSDDDTTIYLFGTVHMLKPGIVWFDDEVKAAFDKSDELALEVVEPDPAEMAAIVGPLAANSGPPTSQLLKPAVRVRYLAALKAYGIPANVMDRVDPWLVAINLSVAPLMKLGYRQDIGVEKVLAEAAKAKGKPVIGLETTREQLGFFDDLPRDVQVSYLSATVNDLPKVKTEFSELLSYWAHGKPDALARLMNKSLKETPQLAKVLLLDRNARWVGWIEKRMDQPGTLFIAVGAGHLSGKGSVIDLLKKDNWKVRRLTKKDFGQE